MQGLRYSVESDLAVLSDTPQVLSRVCWSFTTYFREP